MCGRYNLELVSLQYACICLLLISTSWHVLSKDNIQRVRRDEAAAKAEEEGKKRRAALAVSHM